MKYKDYYATLGVARTADADAIKGAYRKLARKFHPDVSKEPNAEEKFKEVGEAYETLKDPEKRAAFDQLGQYASGTEFRPPPDWGAAHAGGQSFSFDDIDLADLFAGFARGESAGASRARADRPIPGNDYEAAVHLNFEQAFAGTEIEFDLAAIEYDEQGRARRVPHRMKVRVPRGVTDGQKLRVPGKGGKGMRGGRDGDLYLDIEVAAHPTFRVDGMDIHVDLPLAPWEAVLGASVELPTPAGPVTLRVPAATRAGQKLRLSGRGMARPDGTKGDLYAQAQIAVPTVTDEAQRKLYEALRDASNFDPRAHLA
ncbi:MAG: DnaJ C-terminal domain-containing protein [Betaproteobacteria bacterium]